MRVVLVLLTSVLLLSSCGSSAPTVDPDNISAANAPVATGTMATGAAIAPVETADLTSESIATQLRKDSDGKVVVVDRRLFILNLVRDHLESIDSLFQGFESIENSIESVGAKLSDTDIAVMVAGIANEAPQFPLCVQFSTRKSALDSDNKAYAAIDTFCKNRAAAAEAESKGSAN